MLRTLSLRQAIVLGIAFGVLLPALLLGGLLVRDRYESAYRERVTGPLDQYAEILANGLGLPLWNVDPEAARQIVDAVMRNPDVVRVSVEDRALGNFLDLDAPERRAGHVVVAQREIRRDGRLLGHLTVELATGRLDTAMRDEALKLGVTLLVQLSLSFILIFLLLETRLVTPLRELRDASRRLAAGDLDEVLRPSRHDEVGELAAHFDEMREKLRLSFAEIARKQVALERELREHERAEAENRFLALVASETNNAVIVTDAAGRITWVNAAFSTLSGYPLAEIVGRRPGEFLHGAATDASVVALIRRHIAERQPFRDVELLNYDRNGRPYWISIDIQPIFAGSGSLSGFFAIERDVTEAKRMADALREREQYQRALLDNFPFRVWLKDENSRFLAVNQPFADACGQPTSLHLVGKTDDDIWPLDLAEQYRVDDLAILQGGVPRTIEEMIEIDGRRVWYETYKSPVRVGDRVIGLVGFSRDITERKEAEAALSANHEFIVNVIDSLPGIFYLIDADGRFVLWNQNLERISGRGADEIATTRPLELFRGDDEARVAEAIGKVFANGHAEIEAALVASDGRATPFYFTGLRTAIGGMPHLLGVGIDISERRRAECALRDSEAKFAAAINGSADFIALSRLDDGRFTLVNEAFERLTGWSAAEAIGRTSIELGIWHHADEREELVQRLRRGERVQNYYLHLGTRTGEIRECVMSAVVVVVAGIESMVAVVRDETDQRRADAALKRLAESGVAVDGQDICERLVTDLAEALGVDTAFIALRNGDGAFRLVTRAAYVSGDAPPKFAYDATGLPCAEVLAGRISVHAQGVADEYEGFARLPLPQPEAYVGAPLCDEAGRIIGLLALLHSQPLSKPDLARSLVQVFAARASAELARERADAALLASQVKFSALFHASPIAMSVSDCARQYAIVDVNEAWERQFCRSREDILGKNGLAIGFWRNLGDRDVFLADIERHREIRDFEAWLQRGEGDDILCQISGRMIRLAGEDLMVVTEEDVTERRRLERDLAELAATLEQRVIERTDALRRTNDELAATLATLQRAQSDLVRSEKMAALGSLVAGIAHELNTPIGNCLTVASTLEDHVREFAETLQHGLRRSALEGFVDNARTASDILLRNLHRAAELVVSFKQVAVDQTSSQRRAFALGEIVAEILLTLQPAIRKTPYIVDHDIPDDLRCDSYPGPLGQILANLINNALLHGFEGRPVGHVHVSARAVDAERFELVVADDGIGIPVEDQARVFDPFFTTKLGRGGSGLGLHIVYNLVTGVLGGDIVVDSRPGSGTAVRIVAPFVAPLRQVETAE